MVKTETYKFRLSKDLSEWFKDFAAMKSVPRSEIIETYLQQLRAGDVKWHTNRTLTFSLDMIVRAQCAIPDCQNIVENGERRFCSDECSKRYKAAYNKLYAQYIQQPRRQEKPTSSLKWVREEALKRA